jgi:hypothetical protein
MSVDGHWWFYKVKQSKFSAVQLEFDRATENMPILPEVPPLSPRPKAPPLTQEYIDSVLEGCFVGQDLGLVMYHEPFGSIACRIAEGDFPLSCENDNVGLIMQRRILPTTVLLVGIGSDRFAQLPGYLGNMLIHPDEVEQVLASVSEILAVDWDAYFERAKLVLDYGGFDDRAAKDVLKILQALPKALEQVKTEQAGLLVVTSFDI